MTLLADFAITVGLVVSLAFIIFLTKSKSRGVNQTILMVIFSFTFFTSLHAYAYIHDLKVLWYLSFLFDYNFFWVLGPLLWLYVKSLYERKVRFSLKKSLHFFPSMVMTILVFFPKMLTSGFIENNSTYVQLYQENQLIFILLRNIYFTVYLLASIKFFLHSKQRLHKKRGFKTVQYHWIYSLLLGSLTFGSIDVLIRSFELFVFELPFDGGYVTLYAMIFFIMYLGYHGINEFNIVHFGVLQSKKDPIGIDFTTQEVALLTQKIKVLIEKDKHYLDETLSLKNLSDSLQISEKKLSAFLSSHLNTKFKDYINGYRVAAVKEKLKSSQYNKFTVLAIAQECGFNSKASFYRIFKEHVGCSPATYKNRSNDH